MPEEETLELETVAENLDQIEAEPGVNAEGETYIDYSAIASEAIERAEYERLQAIYGESETDPYQETEESTLSVQEIFNLDSEMVSVNAAPEVKAVLPTMPESKAYKLILDGREVYAWFPSGSRLVVTSDGYIYNETGSTITGVISDTINGVSFNSFNDTVSITPMLSGSGNNNAYRYGSRVYITDYYVSGSSLFNSTSYVSNATCVREPGAGYGFSNYQYAMFGLLFVLVLLLIVRFFRK